MKIDMISILLAVIGLVVGFVVAFIINGLRGSMASKKADSMINQAKKEIEKLKRDAAIEQKEEAHKAKMDLDKEIREKKRAMTEEQIVAYLIYSLAYCSGVILPPPPQFSLPMPKYGTSNGAA